MPKIKPTVITEIDKIHLKSYFIDGSVLKGTKPFILISFVLDELSGQTMNKTPRMEDLKKIFKPILCKIVL